MALPLPAIENSPLKCGFLWPPFSPLLTETPFGLPAASVRFRAVLQLVCSRSYSSEGRRSSLTRRLHSWRVPPWCCNFFLRALRISVSGSLPSVLVFFVVLLSATCRPFPKAPTCTGLPVCTTFCRWLREAASLYNPLPLACFFLHAYPCLNSCDGHFALQ